MLHGYGHSLVKLGDFMVKHLMEKYMAYFAVIRGCQVNLRDVKGRFISKGWKIMTTHALMAARMSLPCQCSEGTLHVPCERG